MKNLDGMLKAAKPVVPDLPTNFSQRVMAEIEKFDLTIAPAATLRGTIRWRQLIGGVMLLALALLIVNNVVFEVKMNGSIELLYFGTQFLRDVFNYIPFDLIIPAIVVTGLSSWLVWNSKALKRGLAAIVIGSYLTSVFGGAALAATGINEQIQAALIKEKKEWPLVSWFFKERARFFVDLPNFRMGRVEKLDNQFVWIVDPHGNKTKVILPPGMRVREGQYVSLSGHASGNFFKVNSGRHCNPGRVERYFHHMPMIHQGMDEKMKHHPMMHDNAMMIRKGMRRQ